MKKRIPPLRWILLFATSLPLVACAIFILLGSAAERAYDWIMDTVNRE